MKTSAGPFLLTAVALALAVPIIDGAEEHSYLLQIFMKDAATLYKDQGAGPFFYELIQRKGDRGFGAGNFRSLFESIEREQRSQGRI